MAGRRKKAVEFYREHGWSPILRMKYYKLFVEHLYKKIGAKPPYNVLGLYKDVNR